MKILWSPFNIFHYLLLAASTLMSIPANSGTLMAPMLGYSIYSFDAQADEKTPNYHGYQAQLLVGYSFAQKIDLGLLGTYTPGHHGSARLTQEQAWLATYGLLAGLRLQELVGINLRLIQHDYLLRQNHHETAVPGRWQGLGYGLGISMIFKVTRSDYLQWEAVVTHASVQEQVGAGNTSASRAMSSFTMGLSYAFNDFHTLLTETKLFKGMI